MNLDMLQAVLTVIVMLGMGIAFLAHEEMQNKKIKEIQGELSYISWYIREFRQHLPSGSMSTSLSASVSPSPSPSPEIPEDEIPDKYLGGISKPYLNFCRYCGQPFEGKEKKCSQCGAPRRS